MQKKLEPRPLKKSVLLHSEIHEYLCMSERTVRTSLFFSPLLKQTYMHNYTCCQSAPLIHKQARRWILNQLDKFLWSAVCLWHELENLWNMSTVKGKLWVSGGDVWKTYCICHHPFRAMKTRTVKVVTWGNNVTSSLRALALNLILLQNLDLACVGYSSSAGNVTKRCLRVKAVRVQVSDHNTLCSL